MKRIISIILVAIICCSTMFIPVYAKSSAGVKEEYLNEDKWLSLSTNKTGARYFVDSNDNPVNLFGQARCQHHGHEEDVLYANGGNSVDSLIKYYADNGMNFIRLAIYMPEMCGGAKKTAQQINDFIEEEIDPDVQAIIRNGMYVMLDIHMYPEPEGERTARTLVQFARDYYLPVLIELAKKYKDEPMVAVYELWNEPYAADVAAPPPEDTEGDWATQLRNYFIDAVNEIRKIDTRHVIMVSDHNAGWGCALTELWNGYYKKLDPVYQNTCFSVHASHQQLDKSFAFYSDWWKSTAWDNNICLVFGEIETEGDLATKQGMKNLFNFFSETEEDYHFSGVLWRPHGHGVEYQELWADTGWAAEYCNKGPFPTARYAIEAEDLLDNKHDGIVLSKSTALFGAQKYGTGISLKPNLKSEYFIESTTEVVKSLIYKAGKYKLVVRAAGNSGYSGDFIVGYKDLSGVVHQVARFSGNNSSMQPYYQTVEFTSSKPIVSIVFFGCETKVNSAFIDRVYLVGAAADDQVVERWMHEIPNANKVVFLNGKTAKVNVEPPKVFEYSLDDEDDNKVSTNENEDANETSSSDDEDKESNVTIQYVDSDDETEFTEENVEVSGNKSGITTIVLIVLIVAVGVWIVLMVVFIVFRNKKSKTDENENENDEQNQDE